MAATNVYVVYDAQWYLEDFSLSMTVGDSVDLYGYPVSDAGGADPKGIIWSYYGGNSGAVSMSISGDSASITAKAAGTQIIDCAAADNPNIYLRITITVTGGGSTNVPVTGISLDISSATLYVDDTITVNATVLPWNATNKAVIWGSTASNVATVSEGVITAVGAGSATIYAVTNDGGYQDTVEITVEEKPTEPYPTSVELYFDDNWYYSDTNITLEPNSQYAAFAIVRMSDGSGTTDVKWTLYGSTETASISSVTYTATLTTYGTSGSNLNRLRAASAVNPNVYVDLYISIKAAEEPAGGYAAYICEAKNTAPVEYIPYICNESGVWEEYQCDIGDE